MKVEDLPIAGVKLLTPRVFRDERGSFSETWNERTLAAAGLNEHFVQDNHAVSLAKGTVRALHFQLPPRAQGKLIRVTKGAILDIAVDIRRASATFGQHAAAVLTAESWQQVWVPPGFAHGYVTLEPETHVIYKTTDFYSPEHERGIQWDDPALAIDWGLTRATATLSEKDSRLRPLAEADGLF